MSAPREAFVFVPSMIGRTGGTDTILRKFVTALGTAAGGPIKAKPSDGLSYGESGAETAKRWRLQRDSPDAEGGYDVIEVDFTRDLRLRDHGRLIKILRVAFTSWWLVRSLVLTSVVMYRKSIWQRLQLMYVAALAGVISLYLLLLLKELAEAVVHEVFKGSLGLTERLPSQQHAHDALPVLAQWWHTLGHVLGTAVPAFLAAHVLAVVAAFIAAGIVLLAALYPAARRLFAERGDALACKLACWYLAVVPRTPAARRRLGLATWWFVALALLVPAWATWPRWSAAVAGPAGTLWVLAGFALRWFLENTGLLIVGLTVLGVPLFASRKGMDDTLDMLVASMDYARIGTLRADLTGRLLGVIRAAQRAGYDHVHVLAHGFGAIVALDTLFYTTGSEENGAFSASELEKIGDLVSISPPLTFMQQLFPRHFDRIRGRFPEPEKHQWINVCSPLDILGTPIIDEPFDFEHWFESKQEGWWTRRFRESMRHQAADADANPGDPNNIMFGRKRNVDFTGWYPLDLSALELLGFSAIRAHDWYWNPDSATDFNAFDRIVPLLDTSGALGTPKARDTRCPEFKRNQVWVRGGGVRDGSPIPRGAYARHSAGTCPAVPDIVVHGGVPVSVDHEIAWPRWVIPSRHKSIAHEITVPQELVTLEWNPKSVERDEDTPAWRPHLHRIVIRAQCRTGTGTGTVTLRCERLTCLWEPSIVRLRVGWDD